MLQNDYGKLYRKVVVEVNVCFEGQVDVGGHGVEGNIED